MKIPYFLRLTCVFLLSLIMTHLPAVAMAEGMISTSAAVADLNRAQAIERLQGYLTRQDVRTALEKQGISASEASQRIASLSDQELNQFSKQIDQAQYGGDILFAILIIVLIIFLIRRI